MSGRSRLPGHLNDFTHGERMKEIVICWMNELNGGTSTHASMSDLMEPSVLLSSTEDTIAFM